jgi:hypothetical protein
MAKSGQFKCKQCGRSFGMAAHLGRHMNTVHATRSVLPLAALGESMVPGRLTGEIQAARNELQAQRDQLELQIAALDTVLATLGSVPAMSRRGRTNGQGQGRGGSLRSYIDQVLRSRGAPMRVSEITDAVLRAGYNTRNKTLAKSVGICLAGMPNVTKVERGLFQAK